MLTDRLWLKQELVDERRVSPVLGIELVFDLVSRAARHDTRDGLKVRAVHREILVGVGNDGQGAFTIDHDPGKHPR